MLSVAFHMRERPDLAVLAVRLFFFSWYGDHRDLHSFPTRRSSDLRERGRREGLRQAFGPRVGLEAEVGALEGPQLVPGSVQVAAVGAEGHDREVRPAVREGGGLGC